MTPTLRTLCLLSAFLLGVVAAALGNGRIAGAGVALLAVAEVVP